MQTLRGFINLTRPPYTQFFFSFFFNLVKSSSLLLPCRLDKSWASFYLKVPWQRQRRSFFVTLIYTSFHFWRLRELAGEWPYLQVQIYFIGAKILSNQTVCSNHADWISPGHHFVSKFHGKGGRWTHKTWEPSFVRLSHLSRTEKPKTGLFISLLSLAQVISLSGYFTLMLLQIRWRIVGHENDWYK